MNTLRFLTAACGLALLAGTSATAMAAKPSLPEQLARGRYLVEVGGCNDCHTPGYAQSGGKVPTAQWLTGSDVGFQGPWGTTYASNLRMRFQTLTEQQWVAVARAPMRPPMPSPSLQAMTQSDLRAIYAFIRSLGTAGQASPAYVPPGVAATTPVIDMMPRSPSHLASRP